MTKEHTWYVLTDSEPRSSEYQDTIHISNDAQEEGRRAPWSWKGSMLQCRGIPRQGNGRRLLGYRGRGEGLWDFPGGWG